MATTENASVTLRIETYRERVAEFEKMRRSLEADRKQAIADLLKEKADFIKRINGELRQLGYQADESDEKIKAPTVADEKRNPFAPIFVADNNGPAAGRKRMGAKRAVDSYCAVCEIRGHDLRAHRGQLQKRPFSAVELRKHGLPTRED